MKKNIKRLILLFVLIIVVIGVGFLGYFYQVAHTKFDIDRVVYIYINKEKNVDELLRQLKDSAKIENIKSFEVIASLRDYKSNLKTGRYAILPGETAWDIVNKLNRGLQSPTKVTFNNIRLKEDLVDRISEQMMFGKDEFERVLDDSDYCTSYGFIPTTIVSMFIPNTYEVYWDMSLEKFMNRMKKEYDNFWSEGRKNKAEKLNLTPLQVSTLASIVEEECTFTDEYPVVAGLYLNRLRRGQLLQADPTVKYAVGDFSLQRVLYKHLEVDSPYNTYKYAGLPPSPIRIPSIKGIDAVLNYAQHDYLYMCAKSDFSGRHDFATNLTEHNRNAAKYRAALNQKKIY